MLVCGPFGTCFLHFHYRTPFRHPPPLCYVSLSSLSPQLKAGMTRYTKDFTSDQLAMKTFATASSTKCNPVEICLLIKIRSPSLDPSRLHDITQLESLTKCLTHKIAREPAKPP